MPIRYKKDILTALRDAGYTTYRLRQDHIFSEVTLQAFRNGRFASQHSLEKLCELLDCQPGDLLEYTKE